MKLFWILFLFWSLPCFAINLDSLHNVWNDPSQPDSNRLSAMYQIAWDGYLFTQPDSAHYFAEKLYDYAKKKGLKRGMGNALHIQGVSYYIRGDYEKALDYYTQGLTKRKEVLKENKDLSQIPALKKDISSSLNNIGNIYKNQGEYERAIDYYSRSLKIKEENKDKKGIAATLTNIGIIYKNQGNYAQAIDSYTRSLKIQEEVGDKNGIAGSLNNIGILYKNQGDYEKAIDYYNRSLAIYKETDNIKGSENTLSSIGNVYKERGEYDLALDYFTRSLNLRKELRSKNAIAISLNNIGGIYLLKHDYDKALEYYFKSLELFEKTSDKRGIASAFSSIGNIYAEAGNNNKAIFYNSKALKIAREAGVITHVKQAAENLYYTYKTIGKDAQALSMYELYIQMRDSIKSEENQKEIIRQEYKYEYEKQAITDSIRTSEAKSRLDAQIAAQQAQIKQEQTKQYALYGGLGLLFIFGGFMYNRFRVTSKQKTIIENQKIEVEEKKKEAEQQQAIVEEKNKEITASITYAKRIQSAILPPQSLIQKHLKNVFVLYKPKDIVSGDFYWIEPLTSTAQNASSSAFEEKQIILFAIADCTGHGVPGAMVSVICNNALNRSVREYNISEPGKILDKTREIVIQEFEKSEEDVKDGMDIALCRLDLKNNQLQYAGANNPLWIIRPGNGSQPTSSPYHLIEIKANKQPIGKYEKNSAFTTHTFDLQKNDTLYLFSDGYIDQFGGDRGKKFKPQALRNLLLSLQGRSMEDQKSMIDKAFEQWKGNSEQIDDVCIMGLKI